MFHKSSCSSAESIRYIYSISSKVHSRRLLNYFDKKCCSASLKVKKKKKRTSIQRIIKLKLAVVVIVVFFCFVSILKKASSVTAHL